MNTPNDGGPAFPIHPNYVGGTISVRDYFATAALQGYCGNSTLMEQMAEAADSKPGLIYAALSDMAFAQADAMLAKREKGGQ